jgi:hypothetical protein
MRVPDRQICAVDDCGYARVVRWLKRHRTTCLWVGSAVTAIAILVAISAIGVLVSAEQARDISSPLYPRGQSPHDLGAVGPGTTTGSDGIGADKLLALVSLGIAALGVASIVVVAKITREPHESTEPRPGVPS